MKVTQTKKKVYKKTNVRANNTRKKYASGTRRTKKA